MFLNLSQHLWFHLYRSTPPNTTVHALMSCEKGICSVVPYEFTFITKGLVNLICGQRTWKSNLRLDKAPFYQLGSCSLTRQPATQHQTAARSLLPPSRVGRRDGQNRKLMGWDKDSLVRQQILILLLLLIMASICIRGGLDWILWKMSLLREWSSIGTGCPGKWWSHHPWRCSKYV